MRAFCTRLAAKHILIGQREAVHHFLHEGALSDLDGKAILAQLNWQLARLKVRPPPPRGATVRGSPPLGRC